MRRDRRGLWLILVLLTLAPGVALGASPSAVPEASPSPTPVATPAWPPPPGDSSIPGGLPWRPVTLGLVNGRWLSALTEWAGGLVAVERDEDDRAYAVWTSADAMTWQRSRLPRHLRDAWRLVPFRDQLYLFDSMPREGSVRLALRVWRSRDGATWRRAGDFRWSLPKRHDGIWRTSFAYIGATPERLVLFVVIDGCCGSGGSLPPGARFASLMAAAATRTPHQGLAIWTSTTGARWERGSNEAFQGPDGLARTDDLYQTPRGLQAVSQASEVSILESTDGIEWIMSGSLPPRASWYGSSGLADVDGSLMVASDDEGPGSRAVGNRLGVWLLEADGSWTRTIDIQPAFTDSLVSVGRTVVMAGASWSTWQRWPWIKVSHDGGRTGDEGSSWTGAWDGCVGGLVALGQRVVLGDCTDDPVTFWVTDLPVDEGPVSP